MKQFFLSLLSLVLTPLLFAQSNYWQQELRYQIAVTLNDNQHRLSGEYQLDYSNHSPDTLQFIWFHLWPNAYKNSETALARQLTAEGEKQKGTGYIDQIRFMVDGLPANTEADPENIDVVKLLLNTPLLPGAQVRITTPFLVQLPEYYSRSGHVGQQYMICQWYPKPAVYDQKGWHPFPYLDQGEFYSEFGSFDVRITLPARYVVGATGQLRTNSELERYKAIGTANYRQNEKARPITYTFPGKEISKTLHYQADSVHDFAWFADKDFVIQYDTLELPSGKLIDAFTYSRSNGNKEWKKGLSYVEDAVRQYSGWIGEYPYPVVQAVEGPRNQSSGGMEYPMITLITSPGASSAELDAVITHEVGHNWFYGILGSQERQYPWMDEGLNTYYQFRYEAYKHHSNSIFGPMFPKAWKTLPPEELLSRVYRLLNALPAAQPINSPSTAFANKEAYGIVVYAKTAVWLHLVENEIGRETLDKGMQEYFQTWKFKHPYPGDLQKALEAASGKSLASLFELLDKAGPL